MVTLADNQFAIGETVLDGNASSGAVYRLLKFDGLERQIKAKDQDRPQAHGAVFGQDRIAPRSMTLEVLIRSASAEKLMADIDTLSEAWAPVQDTEVKLSFKLPATGERHLLGRPRRFAVNVDRYGKGWAKAMLEFASPYAFIFGAKQEHTTTPDATDAGGLTFTAGDYATDGHPGEVGLVFTAGDYATDGHPGEVGLTFNSASTAGHIFLDNDGNFPAEWTIKLIGPLTRPSIRNMDQDKIIDVGRTLVTGQTLVLSSVDHTVTLNGVNRYNWLTKAEWFDLPAGGNDIRFTSEASGDTGTAKIIYNHTYL